ncbi:UPF0104 family protein [Rhodococcus sp. D2-41]|uniref:lysylphosphatidylglycerol synthase transmembrane domain-containing protein n=1 Tax=Speluncibacter jeojiensis TaxID=2710754 RepID=UPI002410A89F|nr:YbhN family protein [Rhodococcus sp. D2-41]MDG3010328.1 UPF0104 family protein [Rhodococcus sp. D2-41]
MAESETHDATAKGRRRFWWAKWVVGVALIGLLVAEGVYLWPTLHNSWRALTEVHWGWIAACILAQAASMSSFGRVQQRLLGAAGVRISQRRSLSVIYASTAMSLTLPAGQVFSTAFTYRQTRKWGATPVVASWQVAMSGVLAAAGLAVLGVGGALFVGSSVNPFTVVFSIAGVILLVFAGRYVAAHPDSLEDVGRWALGWYNKVRDKPDEAGLDRWREILHQLEAVQMGRRDTAIAFGWSFYNWVADIACLAFACFAVGAHPGIAGLAIAYAAGKAVGSIPLAPGGLVFVDGTLIAALTAAGMSGAESVAAVLVYRIISFILVAIVGWIIFLLMYRAHQHEDLALDRELLERESHGGDPAPENPDPGKQIPPGPDLGTGGPGEDGMQSSLLHPRPKPRLSSD